MSLVISGSNPGNVVRVSTRSQLREEVASHIRERIVAGHVTPGTLLRLEPLAEQLDVSVTPVREALLLLAQDGWVVQEPHRGFRVRAIDRVDVEDAYLVHAFCAGELAARSASWISPEQLSDVRQLNELMRSLSGDDPLQLEELNYRIHNAIYLPAGSPRLLWFVESAARFVPRRYWATIPGWIDMNHDAHTAIIDALEAGEAETARTRMSTHISAAGRLLVRHLNSIGFFAS